MGLADYGYLFFFVSAWLTVLILLPISLIYLIARFGLLGFLGAWAGIIAVAVVCYQRKYGRR